MTSTHPDRLDQPLLGETSREPRAEQRAGDGRHGTTARTSQSGARRKVPDQACDPDEHADDEVRADRPGRRLPTRRRSAGMRSAPRMRPTKPPIRPITTPGTTAARRSSASPRGRGRGRRRRRSMPLPTSTAAMPRSRASRGTTPARNPPTSAPATDGGPDHPGDEAPVDPPRADVRDRRRRRGDARDRDVGRAGRRRRARQSAAGSRRFPSTSPTRPPATATTKHQTAKRPSSRASTARSVSCRSGRRAEA